MTIHDPRKVFSFTDNPVGIPPGDRLDAQFAEYTKAIASLKAALADVRRSDGAVRNESVGLDQLTPDVRELLPTATSASAENWAYTSMYWAEYLDGNSPIPSNILAIMGITGEHWSSRYWAKVSADNANQYNDILAEMEYLWDQFSDLYLGAKDAPPATDNDGDPLIPGAMYFDLTSSLMKVWNGTNWVPVAGSGGGEGGGGAVSSVNGQIGDVFLDAADVGAVPVAGGTMQGWLNLITTFPTDAQPHAAVSRAYLMEVMSEFDTAVMGGMSYGGDLQANGIVEASLLADTHPETGIVHGQPLPAASPTNETWYVLVGVDQTVTVTHGDGSTSTYVVTTGDWIYSTRNRWDHLDYHTDAYTKQETNELLAEKLSLTGGTMTGALTLSGDPTEALHPVTLQYLQSYITSDSNVYSVNGQTGIVVLDADDVGALALAGGTLTGALTIAKPDWPTLLLSKPDGSTAAGANQIVGYAGGKTRWTMYFGSEEAETGGNVGSNFQLHRFADDGSHLGMAFNINRATGDLWASGNFFGQAFQSGGADVHGVLGPGYIELFKSDGAWIDFKNAAGDDYDVRLQPWGGGLKIYTTDGNGLIVSLPSEGGLSLENVTGYSAIARRVVGANWHYEFYLNDGAEIARAIVQPDGAGGASYRWCSGPTGTDRMVITPDGTAVFYNSIDIHYAAPTLWWRDTDHRSFAIHVDTDLAYFMRGPVNGTTWEDLPNGYHPLAINLSDGTAIFGANIYSHGRFNTDRTAKSYTDLVYASGTITINLSANDNYVMTIDGTAYFDAPTGAVAGQCGVINFYTGGHAISFSSAWKWIGGTPPVPSGSGSMDSIVYNVGHDGVVSARYLNKATGV